MSLIDQPSTSRLARQAAAALLVAVALLSAGCRAPSGDVLAQRGIPVSVGAAPGYVPDRACASCHSEIYSAFQEVGMAQSFFRPSAERMIEDFTAEPFYHQPSQRYYRMRRQGERLFFERYRVDSDGQRLHPYEVEVDWILGSGHTSRLYLIHDPGGELYQLPLAWYSQGAKWGMAPGFDSADHAGLERRVRHECMFCHNAYPEVASGSDAYAMAQTFPLDLPQGIGCQRCHGPGAEHLRAAVSGASEAARSTIVNPAKLAPRLAADICYGCHFQPSVVLAGVRRFGRSIYSFRPGEPLTDYLALLDVDEQDRSREQRFEINHHPYRLEQSACFRQSPPGELSCSRCHDPHRKVAPAARKAHYRDACLSCHQAAACALSSMADGVDLPAVAADDCAACHMSRRRTQDVVQVVMTDHLIRRRPGGEELLAELEETVPILTEAELIRPLPGSNAELDGIYRASAVIRAGGSAAATRYLAAVLPGQQLDSPEPQLDLIKGLLGVGNFAAAAAVATATLEVWPELVSARDWRAIARVQLEDKEGALADLKLSLATAGGRPEPLFNQGLVLAALGRFEEAAAALRQAVELRPNFPVAWVYLGRVLERLEEPAEAARAYRQALSLEPDNDQAAAFLEHLLAS